MTLRGLRSIISKKVTTVPCGYLDGEPSASLQATPCWAEDSKQQRCFPQNSPWNPLRQQLPFSTCDRFGSESG